MSALDDWQKWLRPGDEQYVRGVDPLTGYLNLRMAAGLRQLLTAMFPDLAPSAQRSAEGAHINEKE